MLARWAVFLGDVLLVIGVLGFVPIAMYDGALFGVFEVSTLQNVVHILLGLGAIVVGLWSDRVARLYFQLVSGGLLGGLSVLALLAIERNSAVAYDLWSNVTVVLYLGLAAVTLFAGFSRELAVDEEVAAEESWHPVPSSVGASRILM